ncbi:MAG: TonB-dependent receptor [Comamonadaceae bacterium]|nr:MAG: TonB-dependent receptor [Comamonadaceae bacterium]
MKLHTPASLGRVALCTWLVQAAWPVQGQTVQPQGGALNEVTIQSTREDLQGIATSASEGVVTSRQISTRPVLRAGDLMETVPGLVATQHAGEGKANQYFLRGFNLDHGTDFATYVDGVLVNMPTHGHGQGYTDLYFLIPELVDTIEYRKGPYYAQDGDFAAAGSVRFRTLRRLAAPIGVLEAGGNGYRRAMAAGSFNAGGGDLLLAGERSTDDGPWDVLQNLRKTNLVGKYSQGTAANGWSVGLTHYEASWTSTDQVPQRAVDSGLIGRYGSLDPTSGGRSQRTGLNATWAATDGARQTTVNAYALRYTFDLFSDFSYYTRGCDTAPLPAACDAGPPLDQFEQVDRRNVYGLSATHGFPVKLGGFDTQLTFGGDFRRDSIGEVGLYDTSARSRTNTVRSDSARIDALGLWGQGEVSWTSRLRSVFGLRWDRRDISVNSSVAANSGSREASIASPKASLAYAYSDKLDLYANWGRGFHSNDARGTVITVDPRDTTMAAAQATPLVRATGFELGSRQKIGDTLVLTASAWALKLESELVFVGDAGTTEPSRPSKRKGLEFTANWKAARGLEVDADYSFSHARFSDPDPAGSRVPGALERVLSLGVTYETGPWTLGARLRHFGSHPLIEDNSIRGAASTVVNTRVGYRINKSVQLSLDVFNLVDRKISDVQYAYGSRLPGEAPYVDGVTPATVHFHPSIPRTARVALRATF